jgi:hypothetical protein
MRQPCGTESPPYRCFRPTGFGGRLVAPSNLLRERPHCRPERGIAPFRCGNAHRISAVLRSVAVSASGSRPVIAVRLWRTSYSRSRRPLDRLAERSWRFPRQGYQWHPLRGELELLNWALERLYPFTEDLALALALVLLHRGFDGSPEFPRQLRGLKSSSSWGSARNNC